MRSPLLGIVASSPSSSLVKIAPMGEVFGGMEVRFACGGIERVGSAVVKLADRGRGEVLFEYPLHCSIPAIAEGDEMYEYEIPCSRCRCKRCVALYAG